MAEEQNTDNRLTDLGLSTATQTQASTPLSCRGLRASGYKDVRMSVMDEGDDVT